MQIARYLFLCFLIIFFCNPSYGLINERYQNSNLSLMDDETSISAIVEKFFISYINKDLSIFRSLWSKSSQNLSNVEQLLKRDFDGNTQVTLNKVIVNKIVVQGEQASLYSIIELSSGKTDITIKKVLFTLELVKENQAWKIMDCYSTTAKHAAALIAAKTEEECTSLIVSNADILTPELWQTLLDRATELFQQRKLDKANVLYRMTYDIARKISDKSGMARALNGIANIERVQGNYGQAMEHFQQSLALSQELQDKPRIVSSLVGIANIESAQSNYKQAMEHFQQSFALSEELQDKPRIAAVLTGIGIIYASQNENEKSLDYFQKCLTIYEELKDKVAIVNTLTNIGNIYRVKSDFIKALEYFKKSLELREKLNNKVGLEGTYNNIALIHMSQSNYEQALDFLQKSLALSQENKDKQAIATAFNNIGNVYSDQGDFIKAIEFLQKSLVLREELKDRQRISNTLNNIGIIYRLQGNYAQALDYAQRSLAIRKDLADRAGIATSLNNIGNISYALGNYVQALEQYQQCVAIREEIKDKEGIASTLSNIGAIFLFQGKYQQALDYYQRGLTIMEELKEKKMIAATLSNIGSVFYVLGDYTKSVDFAEKAVDLNKQNNDQDQLWQAYLIVGIAYRALGKIDQGREALEKAIVAIEAIRNNVIGGERARQLFFERGVSPYYEMVRLLVEQGNNSEALVYAERAKARVLLEVLQGGKVKINKAMTKQEERAEQELNAGIISLNSQIYREKHLQQTDEKKLATLTSNLEKTRLELEVFQTNLYANHAELKTQRGEMQPVTLKEASKLFPDEQSVLLEFVVTEEKTYLFVLTSAKQDKKTSLLSPNKVAQSNLRVYTLDIKKKDLEKQVEDFRELLANNNLEFRKPAQQLYDLLLSPAQEQLVGKHTLIIVPGEILWNLPFQALKTSSHRYLLEEYTLSYAPSLTSLREMIKLRDKGKTGNKSSQKLLALGNPTLGSNGAGDSSVFMGEKLVSLKGAEEQVKQLGKLYGPKQSMIYIGNDAREEKVKAEASNYTMLHFATHGILNNGAPIYSNLVLSQAQGSDNKEDGLLEVREIMQMDLHAEMAVLAACETARGQIGNGEGVIGLTWAFFVAGCPTTVVSQWKVEDQSTKELMVEFYRGLHSKQKRLSKAEALRQAALRLIQKGNNHPFYWAGFVLIGDGR